MDPNAALERLRQMVETPWAFDTRQVTDAFEDLDRWLSQGNFLPSDWSDAYRRIKIGDIDY